MSKRISLRESSTETLVPLVTDHETALRTTSVRSTAQSNVLAKIRLEPASGNLILVNGRLELTATALDGYGVPLLVQPIFTATSSKPSKVRFDPISEPQTIPVVGVAVGSSVIRAALRNAAGKLVRSNGVTVNVYAVADVTPASIVLAPTSATLADEEGATVQLTATFKNAAGDILPLLTPDSYASSDTDVATVNGTGLVTRVGPGECTINALYASPALESNGCVITIEEVVDETFDRTAELPREYLDTDVADTPSEGSTIHVASGGNLQTALNNAVPGDVITLEAGATFTGNFTLPAKVGGISGGWITVKTDGTLPAEFTRMTPALAATHSLPKLKSATSNPVIAAGTASHVKTTKWRFIGLEVLYDTSVTTCFTMIELGYGDETSANDLSEDLIFDRMYVHGHSTLDARRAFGFNAKRLALIDSTVKDIHSLSDCQTVMGWNGPGPYKIVNNYLDASGENINWGGATISLANNIPSDIEIRRNHCYKQLSQRGTWLEKNLYESKCSARVLVEGNVFENSWAGGQSGWSAVLWSAAQVAGNAWVQTCDQTFRYNKYINVASGFQLHARGFILSPTSENGVLMERLSIHDNVWIGFAHEAGSLGRIIEFGDGSVTDLSWEHNTVFTPNGNTLYFPGFIGDVDLPNFKFKNNLTGGGQYQIFASDGLGNTAWENHTQGESEILGNVIVAAPGGYPLGNNYPATFTAVGLVGGGSAATSVTAALTDLALSASSPFKGSATDGTDPGADLALVQAAIADVA